MFIHKTVSCESSFGLVWGIVLVAYGAVDDKTNRKVDSINVLCCLKFCLFLCLLSCLLSCFMCALLSGLLSGHFILSFDLSVVLNVPYVGIYLDAKAPCYYFAKKCCLRHTELC